MKNFLPLSILILFSSFGAFAQSDFCASATPIAPGATCAGSFVTGTTSGATSSGLGPCAGFDDEDVWYSFTATSGSYTFNVNALADLDPVFEVMYGTCASLTITADDAGNTCIDATGTGGSESATYVGIPQGATVFIHIYDYEGLFGGPPADGSFNFCVVDNCPVMPGNDACASATVIPATNTIISGDNTCASQDPTEDPAAADICAISLENTIWYEFTAPSTNTFDIEITNMVCSQGTNLQMNVFTGSCPGPWTQAGACVSGAPPGTLSFAGTMGTTYYIVVDGDAGAQCSFDVEVVEPCSSGNDECGAGQSQNVPLVSQTQSCVAGCTTGSTAGGALAGACPDMVDATVWYEVTIPAGDVLLNVTVTSGDFTDPQIVVFDNTCGTYFTNSCTVGSLGSAMMNQLAVTPATTYYIAVTDNAGGDGNFNICIESTPDLSPCNTSDMIVMNPAPNAGGFYQPGQTVEVCYTINTFEKGATCNFLHGIVPSFGDCWDPASFNANGSPVNMTTSLTTAGEILPLVCGFAPSGSWGWYANGVVLENTTSNPVGAGWFFVSDPCWFGDGVDPNTGYGDGYNAASICDPAGNGYTWTVCFELIVGCSGTNSCDLSFQTWADGQTGGWTSPGCNGDLPETYNGAFACCVNLTPIADQNLCDGDNFELTTLNETGFTGTFSWYDSDPSGGAVPLAVTNVTPTVNTTYWVGYDEGSCGDTISVNFIVNPVPTSNHQFVSLCESTVGSGVFNGYDLTSLENAIDGGAGPTITWYDDPTTVFPTGTPNNVNVSDGDNYFAMVDDGTCTDTAGVFFTVSSMATFGTTVTDASCNGVADGSIDLEITGGSTPYSYLWSNTATTQDISGLAANTYVVTITAEACVTTTSVTVNEPAALQITVTDTDASCNGFTDGSVTVTAAGGPSPYTYIWSPGGATSSTVTGLGTGNYSVTVSSASCTITGSTSVSEPSSVTATAVESTSVTCNGNSDGQATASGAGGNGGAYTFNWGTTPVQNTAISTGLASGTTYSVTVYDNTGVCNDVTTVTVSEPATSVTASISGSTSVTCNGASDGTATASGAGGNGAPFSYNWSNGDGVATATNLTAGVTYTVTVTDQFGNCSDITTVTVAEPATSVTASIAGSTSVTCNGANDGTATASGAGGNGAPFTYSWSNGDGVATATGLAGGTHTVTVTDQFGNCTDVTSVTISEPSAITLTIPASTNASCATGTDGAATASASGGVGAVTYLWSAGAQTTTSISGLTPGVYTVTATDAVSCTAVESVTISDNASGPTASIAAPGTVDCANLTVTLDASGSAGGTIYSWSTSGGNIVSGAATNMADVDAQGTYTITVTDGTSGCFDTETVTVTQDLTVPTTTITACNGTSAAGASDGDITVAVGTAPGPYTYSWSPAPATGQGNVSTVNSLPTGTYTVTVTASNGCTVTDGCTVNDPLCNVTVSIVTTTDVSCNGGSNGDASVTMTGGTGTSFTYNWINGQTNSTATGLAQGSFGVTVTDNNSCVGTATANISEPTALGAIATLGNHAQCAGSSDGNVSGSAIGGTTNYSYSWSNSVAGAANNNIPAGVYTLTVTDALSCTDVASVTVNDPLPMALTITCNNTSVAGGTDGSSTTSVTGGDGSYTYSWDNGATTTTLTGLSAGNVALTVSDGNGCSVTDNCNVNDPGCAVTISTTVTNVSCNGGSNGQVIASASGGLLPYNFVWSDGQTGTTATGLSTGNITCTVTDGALCTDNSTVSVSESTAINPNIVCNATSVAGASDGSSTTAATGGASGYTYLWSNGETTSSVTGVAAGAYTVTVTDASLCAVTATCNVSDPGCALVVNTTTTDILCFGESTGSITITSSGGLTPYSFNWSTSGTGSILSNIPSGTYTVTTSDAGSCSEVTTVTLNQPASALSVSVTINADETCGNSDGEATLTPSGGAGGYTFAWPGGQTTSNVTGLVAGGYNVTTSDANGCTSIDLANIGSVGGPNVTVTAIGVQCNGMSNGSASSTATGGVPVYQYTWSNGETTSAISGLTQGTYDLTVTNNDGTCPFVTAAIIAEPTALTLTANVSPTQCNGGADGSASASVSGGTLPYTYSWSNSETTSSISGLGANTYSVTITDDSLCTATDIVTVTEPSAITVSTSSNAVQCNGASDGAVNITVTGGTTPYSYSWDNSSTTEDISGIPAGTYNVTVTDNNSCTDLASDIVFQPAPINLTVTSTSVTCNAGSDGSASVLALGGSSGYSYSWSDSQTATTATGLSVGTASVTVTDIQNCTISATTTIQEPSAITVSTSTIDAACGNSNGSATLTPSGGVSGYNYNWSSGGSSDTETGLTANVYFASVTDANACLVTVILAVNNPNPSVTVTGNTTISCNGGNEGDLQANVSGGTTPYSYTWVDVPTLTPISTSTSVSGLAAGVYALSMVDASPAPNGPCQVVEFITITEPPVLQVTISETNAVSCFGESDGALLANESGGATPYNYSWNTSETTSAITGLTSGSYSVTVTDNNGCTVIDGYTLTQPNEVISPDTVTFCKTEDNVVGISGSPVSGVWSAVDPLVVFVGNADNDSIDIDLTPWTTGASPYQLVYTVAGCSDTTLLVINGAIAGSDLTICESNTTMTLPVATPAGGLWSGNNIINTSSGDIDLTGLIGTEQYIYSSNGCPDTMNLNITANPAAPIVAHVAVCTYDSILFNVSPQGGTLLWYSDSLLTNLLSSDTAFSPPITQYDTTQTYYAVIVANNCTSSVVTAHAVIGDSMVVSFDATPSSGTSPLFVEFNNTSVGIDENFDYYDWTFGDGNSSTDFETEHTFNTVGEFEVQLAITDFYNGCSDSSTVTIITDGASSLVVPVVFSPDGDGINDEFTMKQNNLTTLEVQIYNRWGHYIFGWETVNGGWDGRTFAGEEAPPGTYFAIITGTGLDENENEVEYGPENVAITLVR